MALEWKVVDSGMKTWKIEITKEDAMNVSKWIGATNMMVEAKLRTLLSQSELDTWKKFEHAYHSFT